MTVLEKYVERIKEVFGRHGTAFSNREIVGMCVECKNVYAMQAKHFRIKICKKCLEEHTIIRYLGWVGEDGNGCYIMDIDRAISVFPMLWSDYIRNKHLIKKKVI